MKSFSNILKTRLWVAHIDDERNDGNSIIVTLNKDYVWHDEPDCGVRGFDTVAEVKQGTQAKCVININNTTKA